jgi:hypothetical protein
VPTSDTASASRLIAAAIASNAQAWADSRASAGFLRSVTAALMSSSAGSALWSIVFMRSERMDWTVTSRAGPWDLTTPGYAGHGRTRDRPSETVPRFDEPRPAPADSPQVGPPAVMPAHAVTARNPPLVPAVVGQPGEEPRPEQGREDEQHDEGDPDRGPGAA